MNINNLKNIQNARLPDGSYSNIDSKQLIKDAGAEEQVIISFIFIQLNFL